MNLLLADPFSLSQEYPENLTHILSYGQAVCLRFNRKGDYLASGLGDGTVVVFDFDTYGISRVLRGHTMPITSLSWSRDGRYLLSASRDWKCILWDLKDGSRRVSVCFESAIWGAELHPLNQNIFVVALYEDTPTLVEIGDDGIVKRQPLKNPAHDGQMATLVVAVEKSGQFVFTGTSKGWINIFELKTCLVVKSERVTTANIKHITFSPSGRQFCVNASDRTIRLFNTPDLAYVDPTDWNVEVVHKFQDVVNRLQWNMVTFSANGDYVMAATYRVQHDIYIWETTVGSLVKIIEAPREEIIDAQWHPTRTLLAAAGLDKGNIYIWATVTPQRWSALAPDFVEVDENVEYEEREDEFDIEPDELANKRRLNQEDEDDVDIVTIERVRGEFGEESFIIPIVLDEDEDEDVLESSDSE
ncbi:WD40-repeat-containing domain protein [Lipomyces oligophaga]|uniref:WD40-repeat-containing domain protein n=1 Tax=Lipomyces oligophaga TaxID=45792 RepID=UPI0034CDC44B